MEMVNQKRSSASNRWWDLFAALLLLGALLSAANRLTATHWAENLGMVQLLALLGAVAGLALGQSVFTPRLVRWFGLLYGLFAVPWQLLLTVKEDAILWIERLAILGSRLWLALGQLMRQEAVEDPLFFLFLMSSLAWILSVHAGYTVTRYGHPWRATLPVGVAVLFIQLSDPLLPRRAWYLAAFLFFTLLLVARLIYLRDHARWKENRVLLPPYIGLDVTRVVLQITVLFVVLAWTMPALASALSPAQDTWHRITRPLDTVGEYVDNAFASLRGNVGVTYSLFAESLYLGGGVKHTDEVVMAVEVQPNPPMPVRYYWRAFVYDEYAESHWNTTAFSITMPIAPRQPSLTFPEIEERWTAVFTATTFSPISTLYVPSQPLWVNRYVEADIAYNADGTADLAVLRASPYVRAQDTYRGRSSLSTVTIAQLREAGTDYPKWVTDRYLQLPSTISRRTRELAREIALDLDNPYDIAAAITTYLRTYITYRETVPSQRPYGQDPIDWFLFDLREGYCNYYASAEIVMLRSLGVPARLAVGFAQGERESGSNVYVVRRNNAHAWPEVYFPGLGWIEFEPTVSEPPLSRPLGLDESDARSALRPGALYGGGFIDDEDLEERLNRLLDADDESLSETDPAGTDTAGVWRTRAIWLAPPALILLLSALVWRVRRRRGSPPLVVQLEAGIRRLGLEPPKVLRLRVRRATLSPLERAYLELNQALARLGAPPAAAHTPIERAVALTSLLPDATDPVQQLLAEYETTTYSPRSGNLDIAQQASRTIWILSWQAWIRRLFAWFATQ
jgi:transglutaminase-like putative cysteine protease